MDEELEKKAYQELISAIDDLPLREQICMFMYNYLDVSIEGIAKIICVDKEIVSESIESAKKSIRVHVGKINDEKVRNHCIVKLPFLMDVYAEELTESKNVKSSSK